MPRHSIYISFGKNLRRGEAADVLFNDLLDLALKLGCDVALGDLGEKGTLGGSQVLTELSFPLGDLGDGDGVEETVDTSVDDGDLDLHGKRLVLALLCRVKVN